MNNTKLEKRVREVAEQVLQKNQYVSCIDVLLGLEYLSPPHLQDWQKGRVRCLESVIQTNLNKISSAMKFFRSWAMQKGLKTSETVYLARTRGPKKHLQFSKSGNPHIEKAYRTHYVSPFLSEKKQQNLKEKLAKPPELIVFVVRHDVECSQCKNTLIKGNFLYKENDNILCVQCSGFGDLDFMLAGNALLTRRAKKYSKHYVVVVKWSSARKRYERQGLLVEAEALKKAELECLAKA